MVERTVGEFGGGKWAEIDFDCCFGVGEGMLLLLILVMIIGMCFRMLMVRVASKIPAFVLFIYYLFAQTVTAGHAADGFGFRMCWEGCGPGSGFGDGGALEGEGWVRFLEVDVCWCSPAGDCACLNWRWRRSWWNWSTH